MNQDFGRTIKEYSYSKGEHIFLIVAISILPVYYWLIFGFRGLINFDIFTLIVVVILGLIVLTIVIGIERKARKTRIIVYEYGLRLETHEQCESFAITDITDMQFTKVKGYGLRNPTYFLFNVKSKNGRNFEMHLSPFESMFSSSAKKSVPDMPELVAFYDRWLKARNVTVNISR